MSGVEIRSVTNEDGNVRLDRWFRRHFPNLSHGRLEKLLRTGQIRLDGKRASAGDRVAEGQQVRVPPLGELMPAPAPVRREEPRPEDVALVRRAVLYRDEDVIVIDKPAGLAVQGGTGTTRHLDAMLDALRFDAAERPRLVHRLDKDTSGVLVLARNAAAAQFLTAAFRQKQTQKIYWSAVVGLPKPPLGRVDLALAKLPGLGGERVVPSEEGGRRAVTLYRTVAHAGNKVAWVALNPVTGRTHQLRAHMTAIGTPILGDGKYGGAAAHPAGIADARRLHLHARALALPLPKGGVRRVIAPLPAHMARTWQFFGFGENDERDPFAGFGED
jgi:23S rRNA pseudouridine955/2504/2580 synthase